jgi:hypothetical protein
MRRSDDSPVPVVHDGADRAVDHVVDVRVLAAIGAHVLRRLSLTSGNHCEMTGA